MLGSIVREGEVLFGVWEVFQYSCMYILNDPGKYLLISIRHIAGSHVCPHSFDFPIPYLELRLITDVLLSNVLKNTPTDTPETDTWVKTFFDRRFSLW